MVTKMATTARLRAVISGAAIAGVLIAPAWAQPAGYALTIRNHQFEPTELQIPAGEKIELKVTNADPTPEEFESLSLHREKVVPGGQTVSIYIGPLPAGRYEFFGDFNPKTARGWIVAK